MNVVFTGRAYRGLNLVKRSDLTRMCLAQRWTISERVTWRVDCLIASEDDTQKAHDARRIGVEVKSYAWFFAKMDELNQTWRREWRGIREFMRGCNENIVSSMHETLTEADQLGWRVEAREIDRMREWRLHNYLGNHTVGSTMASGTYAWSALADYVRGYITTVRDRERQTREEEERAAEEARRAADRAEIEARRPAARWGTQAVRRLQFDDI